MKFVLLCTIFFLASALAKEDDKSAEPVKAEAAKPKRQIVSLGYGGYGHHAPYVSHASYVSAPLIHHAAPIIHHASPIVHHAAPIVHHASYVAPYHAAPIVSHAPIVHAASSYSISHQVHHPVIAHHAPLISHAPLVSYHSPLISTFHRR